MSSPGRMPTLFLGHGSPMNALGGNPHAAALTLLGKRLPRPKTILVISAHWRTRGSDVVKVETPETIYDFGGFPKELYQLKYPAPGATELADRVVTLLADTRGGSQTTDQWGLDHGAWAVLRHLYPDADIPVTQLGIAKRATLADHYAIAQRLQGLRDEGVLVIGSGNITHNLGDVDWDGDGTPAPWVEAFDAKISTALETHDLNFLIHGQDADKATWRHAHPTLEHYIPLLYALGAAGEACRVSYPYVGIELGTLSMRCVQFN